MKHLLFSLTLFATINSHAQDIFQEYLYPTDLVLKYSKKLALSAKQINSIRSEYNAHTGTYNSLKWDLDAEMVRLGELLSDSRIDSTKALRQMEKILTLEKTLKLQRLSLLIKVKNTLTEEQQSKLKKYRQDSDHSFNLIMPINENPRLVLRVDGPEASNQPLYILMFKGKEQVLGKDGLADIDPNDIKSISILKDEAATKIYGDKGKNGVVIIKLKK